MLSLGKKWLHVFALLALTFVLATGHPQKRAIIPAIDPFYKPPAGIESAAPGEILRTRRIIPATFGLIPTLGVEAYQLLYRTTAIDGERWSPLEIEEHDTHNKMQALLLPLSQLSSDRS